jgi:hypothetical protein
MTSDPLSIVQVAGLYVVLRDGVPISAPMLTRAAAERLRAMLEAKSCAGATFDDGGAA